jgi:hypothetical protein
MIAAAYFALISVVLVGMAIAGVLPAAMSLQAMVTAAGLIGLFVALFAAGVHVGAALLVMAFTCGIVLTDRPFWLFAGDVLWSPSTSFVFVAVPLFLLMGELMLRTGLSERLYRALGLWFGRLPGGLLHTNIASCAVFSAVAGSSVATAATMGSVALPYFEKSPYPQRLVLGSLAAGGALGNLIPPGITFIIYGLITETSVGDLYLAAIGPSILVVIAFTLVILHKSRGTRSVGKDADLIGIPTRGERLASLLDLLPTGILILLVLGTIYAGIATPTESAALGVIGALGMALVARRLTLPILRESLVATARVTSMIGLILLGAFMLNYVLSSAGITQALSTALASLPLPPWGVMLAIIGFYLAMGTFMEGISMIVTTVPLLFPVVVALGYDPIWFGVVVTMLVEIAMISPPDGTVLYVLQGMRKRPGPITDVFAGVLPFMTAYIACVIVLLVVPGIATWLPNALR